MIRNDFSNSIGVYQLQRLMLNSLSVRMKIIRDSIYEIETFFSFFNSCEINSVDKLAMFLNLGTNSYYSNCSKFFISKNKGFSFFFEIPYLFLVSVDNLTNLGILPIMESMTPSHNVFYRPFRNCYDVIVGLCDFFRTKNYTYWFLTLDIFKFNFLPFWLLKNFLFDKKILMCLISNFFYTNNLLKLPALITGLRSFCSIVNLLLNGLVCRVLS